MKNLETFGCLKDSWLHRAIEYIKGVIRRRTQVPVYKYTPTIKSDKNNSLVNFRLLKNNLLINLRTFSTMYATSFFKLIDTSVYVETPK